MEEGKGEGKLKAVLGERVKGKNCPENELNQKEQGSSGILSKRVAILREAIEEIDRLIQSREKLGEMFKEQIEREIKEVLHQLSFLPEPWREGFLPEMEFLRLSLHKSLTSRRKDRRQEELKRWEHLSQLIREKRKLIMEYEQLLAAGGDLNGR